MQIAKAMPEADHAYMEWVTTYSAATYQEVPAKLEHLIEEVGTKVSYGESHIHWSSSVTLWSRWMLLTPTKPTRYLPTRCTTHDGNTVRAARPYGHSEKHTMK